MTDFRTSRRANFWLLCTVAATLAPHTPHLPIWLSGLCGLLLAWRVQLANQNGPTPNRLVLLALVLATGLGVRYEFSHFFGKDPGTALLAALLCLKLLEGQTTRDLRVAILLSFFLQLTLFFYDQSVLIAVAAIGGTLLATLTLVALHDDRGSTSVQLRESGLLLAQALPFMLVLFVLYPRVQGPLWGLPADAYSGQSGLSDSMEPGSISNLILSDAIAFRAEFAGTPPPPALRYWRGPVLTVFDGRKWRPGRFAAAEEPAYAPAGPAYSYRLTLEPHNQPWILALDFPDHGVPHARYTHDFRLLADAPIRSRTRLNLRAFPETRVGVNDDIGTIASAQQLPRNSNPRTQALGREMAEKGDSAEAVLSGILAHLRASELTYTLQPPLLGTHSIDEFLFDTRQGFCEHFASAFVFLARSAGLPARVVTGYQGGEINPVDGSLVVRQSDAHAWAEAWIAERGWIRIDPTALAAPLRIESGLMAALPQGELLPFMMRGNLEWLRQMRHQWDALSNTWNQWILGYNPERQRELLSRLGVDRPDWKRLTVILAFSLGTLLLALFLWALSQRQKLDQIDREWMRFCRHCMRKGIARQPWEGPMDYARRLVVRYPDRSREIETIARTYARLRYGPASDAVTPAQLAQQIQEFKRT